MLKRIAERQRIRYSQNAAYLTLDVGGQSYRLGMRHQFRLNSHMNQTHSPKQWLRFGDEECDVLSVSHHHEAALENFIWRRLHRIAIRPGAYQISSSYSAQYGWNDSIPLCPTVIFFPGTRRMMGYFDVREAADALAFYRSGRVVA